VSQNGASSSSAGPPKLGVFSPIIFY
jgi:hypothetical protein